MSYAMARDGASFVFAFLFRLDAPARINDFSLVFDGIINGRRETLAQASCSLLASVFSTGVLTLTTVYSLS